MIKFLLSLLLTLTMVNPVWAGIVFAPNTTGSYLACGNASNIVTGSAAETYSFWYYPTEDYSNGGSARLIERDTTGTSTVVGPTVVQPSSGTNCIEYALLGMVVTTNNNTITLNTLTNVIVTTDGSVTAANAHIYINGTEAAYQTKTNGSGTVGSLSGTTVYIANRGTADRILGGAIFEFADWNTQLTSAQVTKIYNGGKTGYNMRNIAPTSLQSWYRFNECPDGQNCSTSSGAIKDQMGNNNCTASTSPAPYGVAPIYSFAPDSVLKDSGVK